MKISIVALLIVLAMAILAMTSCAGYHGSLDITSTGVKADSNKPMDITKTIDKDGNITITYSSKKSPGILANIVTILSLGLIKK